MNGSTPKYIVSLDMGTSSCRAGAVDESGNLVYVHKTDLMPVRVQAGRSEYNADILLETQLKTLHNVLDKVGAENVKALAVSSQRSTVVLWNKKDGRALAPVFTWEDGRAAAESAQAPVSQERIHFLTGLYKIPFFSAPKIAWSLTHIPQVRQAQEGGTLCAAPVASHLIFHLTKGQVFATDDTLAQRMLLLDIHTRKWSEEICNAFGIKTDILPQILSSVDDYGSYLYKGVEIPICVCTGDQQAASYALAEGQTRVNYGTGAFLLHHTGSQCVLYAGTLTSLAASVKGRPAQFLLEGTVNAAASSFEWLKTQGITVDMQHIDNLCASAENPLQILLAFGGLGSPYFDYKVSPAVEGLSPLITPADWVAGVCRGIAFLVADIVYYLRKNNHLLKEIFVSGGLSNSSYLMQFQTDILQTPLIRRQETEGTLLGLAALARQTTVAGEKQGIFTPKLSAGEASLLYHQWQQFVIRHRK